MKKSLLFFLLAFGILMACSSTKKAHKVAFNKLAINVDEADKDTIDWKNLRNFFNDLPKRDSIRITVQIVVPKSENNPFVTEKKYTVAGIKKNSNALFDKIEQMVNK